MKYESLVDYFGHGGLVPREQQKEVLERIAAKWDEKRFFLVSAPVGVGKTHINLATAKESTDAYILTSEKALQEQYMKHSSFVVDIKGRSNYACSVNPDFTVDSAPCLASPDLFQNCMTMGRCDYYNRKKQAIASAALLTNYAYFLYATQAEGEEDTGWRRRKVLVMDEAHTLEDYLVSVATVEIGIKKLREEFGIGDPEANWEFDEDYDYNRHLLTKILHHVNLRVHELEGEIEALMSREGTIKNAAQAKNISKVIADKIKKLNSKLNSVKNIQSALCLFEGTNGTSDMWVIQPNVEENAVKVSPINADFLFAVYMEKMSDRFVFCSATLSNKDVFCRELGLPPDQTEFIEVGTPFNPEKSPIVRIPVGKMGYKELDATMPKIVRAIETIMHEHRDDKGVIHAGTYKITKAILNGLPRDMKERLIARDMHDGMTHHNSKLIKMHESTGDPTVLISPSMTTGLDLADDLSRFQIIVKLPWPSLADARIKKKSQLDPEWYSNKMWTEILQASGRSTRNEEDWCVTYVLDGSFDYFYNLYKTKLPRWFKDRIIFD